MKSLNGDDDDDDDVLSQDVPKCNLYKEGDEDKMVKTEMMTMTTTMMTMTTMISLMTSHGYGDLMLEECDDEHDRAAGQHPHDLEAEMEERVFSPLWVHGLHFGQLGVWKLIVVNEGRRAVIVDDFCRRQISRHFV